MTYVTPSEEQRIHETSRFLFGTAGLIAIVMGLLILIWPDKSGKTVMTAVAAILGFWVLVNGAINIGVGFFSKSRGGWARTGYTLLGVLFIIGGIAILSNLMFAALTVTVFIAITVGVLWIIEAFVSFAFVGKTDHKAITIISGILSLIAGIVLVMSPLYSAVILWWVLGVSLVVLGLIQVVRAMRAKTLGGHVL
ncbi:DUF308 domain-containing protein [Leucobacter sp. UCMA 4100]|uniref:HdeD family acid-resistance protein n=1 Tax=Leucobacter sp. UCMA 4100 TaxID=2810534 RepID=UPI0022EAD133|nr:DUF308 domain-containing protein [Leucobacter sp. UCMA 4100]MDA3147030.1 DUF308 domain-containing protein [Leucobacter sp. UCMA 4100]